MSFINQHRRSVAILTILAFAFLMQISTCPLRAETEQPGSIERVGSSGAAAAKKSPLIPILIGVVVVGAVAAVLILVVFKSKYDIVGTWDCTGDGGDWSHTFTFTGDKESGTWTEDTGYDIKESSYTVDGKDVTWTGKRYFSGTNIWWSTDTFTGKFTDKETMSGTYTTVYLLGSASGTWTATKQ